jgi:putative hydrolase of the HAD superfamily
VVVQTVIFDRDNTLVYMDPPTVARIDRWVSEIAPSIPVGSAVAHWLGWPGPWPRALEEEDVFWDAFWGSLSQRFQVLPEQAEQLRGLGAFYQASFTAYPDTLACLEALRACGLHLAVMTNFEMPSIARTLENAGLTPAWFDVLISSAAIGVRKPDPGAYLLTAEALGVAPETCAFIDDLEENVEAAGAVGMRGILIDREGHSSYAGQRIQTLSALPALLCPG